MKKMNFLRAAGIAALAADLVVICFYLWTLLATPTGPPVLIPLIFATPFWLIGAVGIFFIGKIRVLPGLYLSVSGLVLLLVFSLTANQDGLPYAAILQPVGIAASVLLIAVGIVCFMVLRKSPMNKQIFSAGLFAIVLLCIAALAFLFLLSLLSMPSEGQSTLPVGLLM